MKRVFSVFLVAVLLYTRLVNIGWGMPYPMHPDERNMANSVQSLSCIFPLSTECLNPHFFAYGQLPLYIAYGGIQAFRLFSHTSGQPTYIEATTALRMLSALSSIILVFVLEGIVSLTLSRKRDFLNRVMTFTLFVFSPYAIQLAHFGTTESLLMLFYSLIVYYSLRLLPAREISQIKGDIFALAVFSGLALGTKISSILFLCVPGLVIMFKVVQGTVEMSDKGDLWVHHVKRGIYLLSIYGLFMIPFFILASPHNFLHWSEFISSMTYESRVGLGRFVAFYTRQFIDTTPVLFQFQKILPYSLGMPQLILGILGFIFLPWHKKNIGNRFNLLRIALILALIPSSFFFSKWTRFIAPSFPLFSLFAVLFVISLYEKSKKHPFSRYVASIICLFSIIPAVALLSVYQTPDVRFSASEWIYANIPNGSKILSETANAIDLPAISSLSKTRDKSMNYYINSFYFYDLDQSFELQKNLDVALKEAEYIIIPTRRVFYNHTCIRPDGTMQTTERCLRLQKTYPLLNSYYQDLFSGKSGFVKVAEFSSFPKISFGKKTLVEFDDEDAEETWTVFDHPVVRIYKRASQTTRNSSQLDFTSYPITDYLLGGITYRLLVADSPNKWERGLMYVKSKMDISGLDGMIFSFPDSQIRTFWNMNTLSHLTLYWLNKGRVVGISDLPSIGETGTVTTVSSPSNADTVIEIIK